MTKDEMLELFEVQGFAYGFCIVKRKSDGVQGTLDFYTDDTASHWVRYYHNFQEA
jgi:hypothetical protein